MSEYQYYEFMAVDNPLNEKDMQALRNLSSRAQITPTSFVNEYHWGDFKGKPLSLMEKYFDGTPDTPMQDRISEGVMLTVIENATVLEDPKNVDKRGNLAWAAQAAAQGHNPVTLRKSLVAKAQRPSRRRYPRYKPGTRLIREWQGVTHEVTIEEKGYTWNGIHYRSLSHIAREITGTRWSGPRFFGLTGEKP